MKIWNVVLRLTGLMFLLLGSLLAIRDGFFIDWWQTGDLIWICGLVSVFVTLLYIHWASGLGGAAAGCVAAFLVIRRYQDEILKEAGHLVDQAVPLINEYHHLNLPQSSGGSIAGDSRYFLFLAALLSGLVMGVGIAWRKVRILSLLPVAAAYFSGMAVGNAPGILAIVCLVCGLGISFAVPVKTTGPVVWKTSLLTLVGLFFVLWIMAAAYQPVSELLLKNHDLFLKRQIELEDRLLELTRGNQFLNRLRWAFGGNENQAVLSMNPPRQDDTVVFEMTVDVLPQSPVYVKDFTSSQYENGIWQAEEGRLLSDFLEEQGYLNGEASPEEQGYPKGEASPEEQSRFLEEQAALELTRPYRCLEKGSSLKSQTVVMELRERTGNTTLWPYFCDMPGEAEGVGDAGIRTGIRRYEASGYPIGLDELGPYSHYIYRSVLEEEDQSTGSIEEDTVYSSSEYASYLSRYFGGLNTPMHQMLASDLDTAFEVFGECVYSFDLEPVPEGSDIVEDFLFRQKKGYCMHFASAVALIMQSIRVPVRYASGYVVLPGDFQENEDGTYTAAVPQYRGHAWVEFYQEDFGWYPLEVTPPSYFNDLERAGTGTTPGEAIAARQGTEGQADEQEEEQPDEPEDVKPKELAQPDEQEDEAAKAPEDTEEPEPQKEAGAESSPGAGPDKGSASGPWTVLGPVLAWIFGILALLAALLGLVLARVRWIWRRRDQAFGDKDSSRAALSLFSAMLGLLRISGIRLQPQEDELVFARRVEDSLEWMEPGTFGAAVKIVRTARFGNTAIREEERRCLMELYEQLMAQAIGQMDQKRLLWYRFFHVKVRI